MRKKGASREREDEKETHRRFGRHRHRARRGSGFRRGSTAAQTVSVAEAVQLEDGGRKVQVSGNVVPDSFKTENDVLTFQIYDPDSADGAVLPVRYDGAAASTFGNDVTAICTGKMGSDGVLSCSGL